MKRAMLSVILSLAALLTQPAVGAPIVYTATLAPEVNGAAGSGSTLLTIDVVANTMRVQADFTGLSGITTVAHIHCCTTTPGVSTAGVATAVPTFPDFPVNVSSGTYDRTFDVTQAATWNPTFVTNNGGTTASALNALLLGLDSGRAYLNVHSTNFQSGEIRGFYQVVPLPAGAWLLGTALAGLAGRRWLLRRS